MSPQHFEVVVTEVVDGEVRTMAVHTVMLGYHSHCADALTGASPWMPHGVAETDSQKTGNGKPLHPMSWVKIA